MIGALVGLFLLFNVFWVGGTPEWLIRVPSTRDPRLVGSWSGVWSNGNRTIVLNADGTGIEVDRGKLQWGTQHGTLYMKCRSAGEGWDGFSSFYGVATSGHTVEFWKPSMLIPGRMDRVDAPAKILGRASQESSAPALY